jgi:hypothetical protein
VVAVGDERSAAYLTAHPDAEDRHYFVVDEANQRGRSHRPEELDGLRGLMSRSIAW